MPIFTLARRTDLVDKQPNRPFSVAKISDFGFRRFAALNALQHPIASRLFAVHPADEAVCP